MKFSTYLKGGLISLMIALPAMANAKGVTIVLSEELDIVDPCEASRSKHRTCDIAEYFRNND